MRISCFVAFALFFILGCQHADERGVLPYSYRDLECYLAFDFIDIKVQNPTDYFRFHRISREELIKSLHKMSRTHIQSLGSESIRENQRYQEMINSKDSVMFKGRSFHIFDGELYTRDVFFVVSPSLETNIYERSWTDVSFTNSVEYLTIGVDPPDVNDYSVNIDTIDDEMMRVLSRDAGGRQGRQLIWSE